MTTGPRSHPDYQQTMNLRSMVVTILVVLGVGLLNWWRAQQTEARTVIAAGEIKAQLAEVAYRVGRLDSR